MAITVFTHMDTILLEPVTSSIDASVTGLTTYVAGPLKAAAILYIALYGIAILRGAIQEPFWDYIFSCVKIVLVVALATSAAEYNYYVKNVFFDYLPREIGSAMNSGTITSNQFDSLLNAIILFATEAWGNSSWGFQMIVDGFLIFAIFSAGLIISVIGYIVAFYAKIGLALVLSVGPVFIALFLFSSTRRFTEGWLGQIVNFVILQVLVVALGSLIINALLTFVGKVSLTNGVLEAAATACAICFASAYVFFQLPYIASSLAAGGAALTYGRMPPLTPRGDKNNETERGVNEPGTRGRQPG